MFTFTIGSVPFRHAREGGHPFKLPIWIPAYLRRETSQVGSKCSQSEEIDRLKEARQEQHLVARNTNVSGKDSNRIGEFPVSGDWKTHYCRSLLSDRNRRITLMRGVRSQVIGLPVWVTLTKLVRSGWRHVFL